jgi:class 3 adenylate cyclase
LPDDEDQWSELIYVEEAVRRNGHSRKQDSAKGKITAEDSYAQATVLFANIVGFTSRPATHERTEIILFLNGLFTRFDIAVTRHSIEKIKTIADGYMAA